MAEFLWTFGVQEVLKKVLKLAAEQIRLAWGLEKELSKLSKKLLKAEALIRDINARKLHHDSVRIWVDDLQLLLYQADDLLDEIVYENLRQKLQKNKVRHLVSPSYNAFIFRRDMAKKMKNVMDLLHKHYFEAVPLGLVENGSVEPEIDFISQFRETTSELDDCTVVGRDVEVEIIVKQVIGASNQQLGSILPIVGMGGLGKTTLAKLVFNHEMVKQHFDKTVWVCVSEPFVVNQILGAILQNLTPNFNCLDNRQVLIQELQKEMQGKRYFLVLDDVWNENSYLWDEFKKCLMMITRKSENSSILVTTRSADVVKIMETLPSHHLRQLSDDQCWFLFTESASRHELSMTSSLEVIRKELVKKIGGIPLVARVLGRALKFEGDNERWVKTLESVIRTPLEEENFVLSILKLSVDRLPSSSLKQCFAYCSNFPKDFVFEKKNLVQMWMAQGFIQPQEGRSNVTIENVGDVYFNILLSRCLFQDVSKDDLGRTICCKMHDLIHDIACAVSNDKKYQLNHTAILVDEKLRKKGSEKIGSKKLHTMICNKVIVHKKEKLIDDKIIDFISLRVLIINSWPNDKLPDSIGMLKHLRYLEILNDGTTIELPKSIVLLYNLQTLRIKASGTQYLPENLRELVNLRHLEVSRFFKKMPPCLSQMTQLQTLSVFVVGVEKDCSIAELGPLKSLKGSLQLFCLEKVKSKEEVSKVKLVDKELDKLEFHWPGMREGKNYNDLQVLEGLQPHKNLQSLKLSYFAGKYLPNKIFVENLRIIELWYCKNCETLPMLGHLNNLKELYIRGLESVRSIGNEFYGNVSNQNTIFSNLEKFELYNMVNLEKWEELRTIASSVTMFCRLKMLRIEQCPKLLNIADFFGSCDEDGVQHLKSLKISYCGQLSELPKSLQHCHSIEDLDIGPLQKLPENLVLTKLRKMIINGCIENYDFRFMLHLSSLIYLCLNLDDESSNATTQLPEELQHLICLESLSIHFSAIEVLPEWLGNLESLETLQLYYCKNLNQMPSKQAMLRLTKLRTLDVYGCPQLQLGIGDTEYLSHLLKEVLKKVRIWVDDLQVLVYQADDLLDDIVYEHLRQKVQIGKLKKEVLKKVLKLAAEQVSLACGLEEELSKLRKELLKAEALVRDINTRKLHHDSVRMWVDDLQVLVYQADDLLDEIVYEDLRSKGQIGKLKKVRNLVSPSNNAFVFRLKMAKKMKNVVDLLHKHYSEAGPLGLVGNESAEQEIDIISQFRDTTSELDEYEVVGRDVEVESIVKQVIDASNQQVMSILPIVGMGGLGKTTLAKLVFNHEMVKQHFDKAVWICVSEPFVVNKILGEILQNLTDVSNNFDKRQVLLQKLIKEMHGKRCFLVLDDVWNENADLWGELKNCLINIAGKSQNSYYKE